MRGPLPANAASHPFGGAAYERRPENLKKVGYVEEEYLVSGKANVYTWPEAGPARVRTPDAPYTTRILVRRPARASRFSGNVVTEMLNPSNLFDLNIGWAMAHRQLVANGDVWVGVTAKPVSVAALKKFDAQRYASLSFANPLPPDDPRNCASVPSDSSRATENGLAWDIYSQLGSLLRVRGRGNPLGYGERVRHVYGFGYSQTGGYLYNYINGIHPLDVRRNGGRPVYDGYIVAVAGGDFVGAVPMNQCEAAPPTGDPRKQFRNVGVPIIHIMSQSDYLTGIAARRPTATRPPTATATTRWPGQGTPPPTSCTSPPRPPTSPRPGSPYRR
ncbi:hypothetical protein GEV43_29990 [Actinomadura sp. J1-007]|nr:hypothetical protein [Actinomadura sp. J1-007]